MKSKRMNQVGKKCLIKGAIACAIFALSVPAMALKTDTQQPITINSVKQSLDLEKISPYLQMTLSSNKVQSK